MDKIPVYRIMNENGEIVKGASMPDLDIESMIKMYSMMIRLQVNKINFKKSYEK